MPKDGQSTQYKKEALPLLKKGVLAYLRKGYSIQAVVEAVNGKFPEFEVTDADVRKILPKVASKKRAAAAPAKPIAFCLSCEGDWLFALTNFL